MQRYNFGCVPVHVFYVCFKYYIIWSYIVYVCCMCFVSIWSYLVCVCVFKYMHIRECMCVHVHVYVFICTHVPCVCMSVHIRVHMCTPVWMSVCELMYIIIHRHVCYQLIIISCVRIVDHYLLTIFTLHHLGEASEKSTEYRRCQDLAESIVGEERVPSGGLVRANHDQLAG